MAETHAAAHVEPAAESGTPARPSPKRLPFRARIPQPSLEYGGAFGRWLRRGESMEEGAGHEVATHPWWKVMWLTGVLHPMSTVQRGLAGRQGEGTSEPLGWYGEVGGQRAAGEHAMLSRIHHQACSDWAAPRWRRRRKSGRLPSCHPGGRHVAVAAPWRQ